MLCPFKLFDCSHGGKGYKFTMFEFCSALEKHNFFLPFLICLNNTYYRFTDPCGSSPARHLCLDSLLHPIFRNPTSRNQIFLLFIFTLWKWEQREWQSAQDRLWFFSGCCFRRCRGSIWCTVRRWNALLSFSLSEAESKEQHGVWDPMPEFTIPSPHVHSSVDSKTFTMGNHGIKKIIWNGQGYRQSHWVRLTVTVCILFCVQWESAWVL